MRDNHYDTLYHFKIRNTTSILDLFVVGIQSISRSYLGDFDQWAWSFLEIRDWIK